MSLIIIAFPSAPVAGTEWKQRDDELDTEIRKKTIGKNETFFFETFFFFFSF